MPGNLNGSWAFFILVAQICLLHVSSLDTLLLFGFFLVRKGPAALQQGIIGTRNEK